MINVMYPKGYKNSNASLGPSINNVNSEGRVGGQNLQISFSKKPTKGEGGGS